MSEWARAQAYTQIAPRRTCVQAGLRRALDTHTLRCTSKYVDEWRTGMCRWKVYPYVRCR